MNPQIPTTITPLTATQRQNASVPTITFGQLTHNLSSNTVWEARVGRFVGRLGRIELLLDLLNNTAEEALATDNLFSPTFGQPTVFVDRRRAMLSVRMNVGR